MNNGQEQIELFLRRCDELMQSKFIIADTKIGELLQSIAMSDFLYAFFRDITKSFDYTQAKVKYMNYAPYGQTQKKLLFPEDVSERLAFTFCLLMDFDNKTLDFSQFLQEYFYEDGSYYEGFHAFCNQVIKPFRNDVNVMFRDISVGCLQPKQRNKPQQKTGLETERDSVYESALTDAQKVDALLILNALEKATDHSARAALLCGYLYFASVCGRDSETVRAMKNELEAFKEQL